MSADRSAPPGDGKDRAMAEIERGLELQGRGEIEQAIACYRRSIAICPTAEGHTYLGWALSFSGSYAEAIAECEEAIRVDPDFGNPYNDIGVYLMHLGRDDEAMPWLRRATTARRYQPRHFPHLNLSRIHEKNGRLSQAIDEIASALRHEPADRSLHVRRHLLLARLN